MSLKVILLALALTCMVCVAFFAWKRPRSGTLEFLYKIVTPEEWKKAQEEGYVPRGVIDTDFIHLSTEEQLDRILAKFWKDKSAVILKLETSELEGDLRFETNPGGSTKFYHLYDGKIPTSCVKNSSEK